MAVLILDEKLRDAIKLVIEEAKKNKVPLALMKEMVAEPSKFVSLGDNPKYAKQKLLYPINHMVFLTYEQQPKGWSKHISISEGGKEWPSEVAVRHILQEYGFEKGLGGSTMVYPEPEFHSISVIDMLTQQESDELNGNTNETAGAAANQGVTGEHGEQG